MQYNDKSLHGLYSSTDKANKTWKIPTKIMVAVFRIVQMLTESGGWVDMGLALSRDAVSISVSALSEQTAAKCGKIIV